MDIVDIIYKYAKKEGFYIDKSEFLFQLQSHPNYPNLVAVVDTLNFFDISSGVFRVDTQEYHLLPLNFVTFLDLNSKSEPYFIEKRERDYFYNFGKRKIKVTETEFENITGGIFLFIEKEDKTTSLNSNQYLKYLPVALLISFILCQVFLKSTNFVNTIFLLFSASGLLLSIFALKDFFGINSSFVNNLCNANSGTDCTAVITSKKWRLFDHINFSDLSLLFFSSQLLGHILFLFTSLESQFFIIQKSLLYLALPFAVLSIYYQKFVEKKWCTICLSIIFVLLIELVYLTFFHYNWSFPTIESVLLLGTVFFSLLVIWQGIKKVLTKQKELREFFIKGSRFSRNYEIFKNTLVTGNKISLPSMTFELGNKECEKNLIISTNPFCGYCKEAHFLLEKVSNKHSNDLSLKIILNVDLDALYSDKKEFCLRLVSIYLLETPQKFSESIHYWFENKNIDIWNKQYSYIQIAEKAEEILKSHHLWAVNNKYQFTPAIFINRFPYPQKFDRDNLPYFMEEVLEDEDW